MTRLALALLSMLLAAAAFGADARKYAVLSLIGDEMLIVGAGQATGQRLDRNPRNYVRVDDPIIDKTVLLTANETLKAATGAEPVLLFARERPLYAMQQRLMNEGQGMVNLLGYIRPLIGTSGATHLVLFTKARREARMQLADMALGTGMVEGVGFYVDPNTEVIIRATQQNANGFVAAFTYFDVALVDLAKGAIVAEQRVTASKVMAAPAAVATEVWSGISGAEKMRMLQSILRKEVERTIPALLKESN
ncbi:MAG TPA: hypothetical protein VM051_14680 [Usitatibacter sp.]|nr:hypothetical protein [Usitatibacter sp.]